MSRVARKRSNTGIYHIMLRGTNRQEIFHDEGDRLKFLDIIGKYKIKSVLEVYGWCLMDNHVHLLIKEGEEEISVTMKRIGVSYASYYNWKYQTTGHLFQDRFRSENIENDSSLLAVIRYIHQNPVKAGMVQKANAWKWSSYKGYCEDCNYPYNLLDSELILELFSGNKKDFIEFNELVNDDYFLDDYKKFRLTDEEALLEITKVISECNIAQVKTLPKLQRDKVVAIIKNIDGVSQRQISRILGIPLALINRA